MQTATRIHLYLYESKVDRYWETLLRLAVKQNTWYPKCNHAMQQIPSISSTVLRYILRT